jgi:uncharacterized protein
VAAIVAVAASLFAIAAPQLPELTGRVVDAAGILAPDDRARIESELEALEAKSTDQLVVATLPSLQGYEIEDFGYQLGRKWGIGRAGTNNGVILIIAPSERKVRIEVGRGLEPLLTDLMSKLIIENAVLPAFRRGDFAGGILAGVRDIKDVLLGDAESVKERAREDMPGPDYFGYVMLAFWIAILVYVIYAQMRHAGPARRTIRSRRSRQLGDSTVADTGSGTGTWSGGGWSSGSDGSGWSGGGGDFGGGGASGSW